MEKKIDFIGVGFPRSGSSWTHEMISAHPQLCGSNPKEAGFFNDPELYKEGWSKEKKYYRHCKPGQLKGEFHPGYIKDKDALERIREHNPNIKIIVCLRNPVYRTFSHFHKHKAKGKEFVATFDQVIEHSENPYVYMSRYPEKIKLLYSVFPKEQVHFIKFSDIGDTPRKVVADLYAFLGVDADYRPENLTDGVNTGGQLVARSLSLAKVLYRLEALFWNDSLAFVRKLLVKMGVRRMYDGLQNLNKKHLKKSQVKAPRLKPEDTKRLYNIFKDDIDKTEKLTNLDLNSWRQ